MLGVIGQLVNWVCLLKKGRICRGFSTDVDDDESTAKSVEPVS
jgi:hypothetical protein